MKNLSSKELREAVAHVKKKHSLCEERRNLERYARTLLESVGVEVEKGKYPELPLEEYWETWRVASGNEDGIGVRSLGGNWFDFISADLLSKKNALDRGAEEGYERLLDFLDYAVALHNRRLKKGGPIP